LFEKSKFNSISADVLSNCHHIYNAFHITSFTTIFVPFCPCLSIHPFQNSSAYHVKSAYTLKTFSVTKNQVQPILN